MAEPRLRIDLYRRLALAEASETIHMIAEELADRFGPLPKSAEALIAVSEIRVLAEEAAVRRVETEGDRLIANLLNRKKAKSSSNRAAVSQDCALWNRSSGSGRSEVFSAKTESKAKHTTRLRYRNLEAPAALTSD